MIRTIITAITGGKREWWVIRWNSQYWSTQRAPDMFPEASVIRDRLTRRAALRLARPPTSAGRGQAGGCAVTEDEAKTKACPMAATFGGSQQLADGPGPNCIGPACMAWRWYEKPRGRPENSVDFIEAIRDHRAINKSTLSDAKAAVEAGWRPNVGPMTGGFCGLAGAPL